MNNFPNCSSKEQLRNYIEAISGRMGKRYVDLGHTTQPCISLESLDYNFRYNGYSSNQVKHLYSGKEEKHLAELLLNVSSAVKIEFNFRLKRLQLMTQGRKCD